MGVRLTISRLASADARVAAARVLAVVCAVGFVLTMIVLFASGGGLEQWFFVLLVWALFVYMPLRILLEAAQTLAPALRRRLITQETGRPGRYATRSGIELMVDGLFDREVVMPRITTPAQAAKARDGAVAVLGRVGTADAVLRVAAGDCLAAVDRWTGEIGRWAARDAGQNIQARWGEVRALAALAAMTKVLLAADEDRAGMATHHGGGQADAASYLDACLDYCDDLALDVDVTPWDEPSLNRALSPERAAGIRAAWKTYVETGSPALEARAAFLDALFTASSQPARPSA